MSKEDRTVKYVGNQVDAREFPDCHEVPVVFSGPTALEAFLEEQGYPVTDHICPCCGTHMVEIVKLGPVPIQLKGLVGCLNVACPGADQYYLPSHEMRRLSKREYLAALEDARRRGRAFYGLPG